MLASIDLGEEVGTVGRRQPRRGLPEVQCDAGIGVPQSVLEERLAPVFEQVHRALELPPRPASAPGRRGLGDERAEPFAEVAGEPEHEPLELLLEVVLVDQLAELLVLHAVRRPRTNGAASEIHGDRGTITDRGDQVELAALELELEAVDPQPFAEDVAGRLGLGRAQRVVQRGRTEAGLVVVGRGRDAGQQGERGEGADESQHEPRSGGGGIAHAPHDAGFAGRGKAVRVDVIRRAAVPRARLRARGAERSRRSRARRSGRRRHPWQADAARRSSR